jgi:hypothetical protein
VRTGNHTVNAPHSESLRQTCGSGPQRI